MVRVAKFGLYSGFSFIVCIAALVGSNLWSYQRLAYEELVGTLSFEQQAPQRFKAVLSLSDGTKESYLLTGDEWQMDVRLIKWKTWLAFLGKDPIYQLDRISGRYASIDDERTRPRTAYPLYGGMKLIDVWEWVNRNASDVWGMDATYGSAVYLPMQDGAKYQISLSHTGLFARLDK